MNAGHVSLIRQRKFAGAIGLIQIGKALLTEFFPRQMFPQEAGQLRGLSLRIEVTVDGCQTALVQVQTIKQGD